MPAGVVAGSGEEEEQLVAAVVVGIERSIPAVGYLILSVNAIDNILSYLFTICKTVYSYIFFGIQIQTHQQCCCTCLRPHVCILRSAAQAVFLIEERNGICKLFLDEIEDLFRRNLREGVLRRVVVAYAEGHVAESVEQTKIIPATQNSVLHLQCIPLILLKIEFFRIQFVETVNGEIGLGDTCELRVPFVVHMARDIGRPCVIVELTPHTAVIPTAVAAGGNDQLVGREFVYSETRYDGPIAVFKRAECHRYNIVAGIEIVVGAYLAIKILVQIGTSR